VRACVQCFCEAGYFGDIVIHPSGLQRRTCNRTSQLTLDAAAVTWETFGEGYTRTLESPGDWFKAHLTPNGESLEVAMQGKTTSWIAWGVRSLYAAVGLCSHWTRSCAACLHGGTGMACTASEHAQGMPCQGAAVACWRLLRGWLRLLPSLLALHGPHACAHVHVCLQSC
jgi:hypothetical protein